ITDVCTYHELTVPPEEASTVPIGRPCRNTAVVVLTGDDRAAGVDEVGELCIRGSGVAMGYWNAPELTGKVFVQNPLNPRYNDLIYRTGDLVRMDADGVIHYLGRKDHQIKHLGYRIELGEIESAAASLPQVDHCCALYDADAQVIHLVVSGSEQIDLAGLRRALASRLPKYMVPGKVHFKTPLPLNPNGKIDRKRLEGEYVHAQ
ncbi:MAG: AMP-binding protein, partial [Propionicimonas sp.]